MSELANQLDAEEAGFAQAYAELLDRHQSSIDAKRAADAGSSAPVPPDKRSL